MRTGQHGGRRPRRTPWQTCPRATSSPAPPGERPRTSPGRRRAATGAPYAARCCRNAASGPARPPHRMKTSTRVRRSPRGDSRLASTASTPKDLLGRVGGRRHLAHRSPPGRPARPPRSDLGSSKGDRCVPARRKAQYLCADGPPDPRTEPAPERARPDRGGHGLPGRARSASPLAAYTGCRTGRGRSARDTGPDPAGGTPARIRWTAPGSRNAPRRTAAPGAGGAAACSRGAGSALDDDRPAQGGAGRAALRCCPARRSARVRWTRFGRQGSDGQGRGSRRWPAVRRRGADGEEKSPQRLRAGRRPFGGGPAASETPNEAATTQFR